MPAISTERVLVVPTTLFHELGHFQGFCADAERYLATLLDARHTSYLARSEAEHDPSFKQLIPYCIFRHRDAAGRETLFQYTRGKGQGEGRLHSKQSIGIGGHISADDRDKLDRSTGDNIAQGTSGGGETPYQQGMQRELDEEVTIGSAFTQRCVGLINDDETEVGKVHLGVVHLFDVEQPTVEPSEPDIIEAGFRPVATLLADQAKFETWSQICLQALFGNR